MSSIKIAPFLSRGDDLNTKLVPTCPLDNKQALVQTVVWCRSCDKPLFELKIPNITECLLRHQALMNCYVIKLGVFGILISYAAILKSSVYKRILCYYSRWNWPQNHSLSILHWQENSIFLVFSFRSRVLYILRPCICRGIVYGKWVLIFG